MIRLAKNPGIGHMREELADKRHRFLLVYSYLIVYRSDAKPLQIIRILHAARDLQSILRLARNEPEEESPPFSTRDNPLTHALLRFHRGSPAPGWLRSRSGVFTLAGRFGASVAFHNRSTRSCSGVEQRILRILGTKQVVDRRDLTPTITAMPELYFFDQVRNFRQMRGIVGAKRSGSGGMIPSSRLVMTFGSAPPSSPARDRSGSPPCGCSLRPDTPASTDCTRRTRPRRRAARARAAWETDPDRAGRAA